MILNNPIHVTEAKTSRVTLRPYPVSVGSYLRHGLVQPVCRWADGSVTSNSFDILAKIFGDHNGNPDVSHRFCNNLLGVLCAIICQILILCMQRSSETGGTVLFLRVDTSRESSGLPTWLRRDAGHPTGKREAVQCRVRWDTPLQLICERSDS